MEETVIMNKIRIYERRSLDKLFNNINRYKMLYVSAGMGYGKTTAVKNYLNHYSRKHLWFTVDSVLDEKRLFQRFYEMFRREMGISSGVKDFEETLVNILESYVLEQIIIVIDNWSYYKFGRFDGLLKRICRVKNENIKIIIISHTALDSTFSEKNCFEIKQESFEFSSREIIGLFNINNLNIHEKDAEEIVSFSGGWISIIYLILADYHSTGSLELNLSINEGIKQLLYERFKNDVKISLLKASMLERFTAEQAAYVTDTPGIIEVLENMRSNNFFIVFDIETKTYCFHNILKRFFENELLHEEINIKELHKKNAEYFHENGMHLQAIESYYAAGINEKVYELMEYINPADLFDFIPGIANKILVSMPSDEQLKYPIIYLSCIYSYILCVDSEQGIEKLNAFEEMFDKNTDKSSRLIKAEILLVRAFVNYGDFKRFSQLIKQAHDIFDGSISRIIKKDTVFNFGVPCVLYLYHKQVGGMKQLCDEFKTVMSMISSVTNGCGSGLDYIINAEACMETGRYDEVYPLVKKAFYKANYNPSSKSVVIELYSLLARYYVIKDNFAEVNNVAQIIESIKQDIFLFSPCLKSQIEMSMGYLWGCLHRPDKMPKWIRECDVNQSKAAFQGKEACFVMFGIVMILKNEFERLLVHSEVMEEKYVNNGNVYRLIYAYIFAAIANYKLNNWQAAYKCLTKATELAEPDNIELPFIELSSFCIDFLDEAGDRLAFIKAIYGKCREYTQIIKKAAKKDVSNRFNLSSREHEVLKLLASGRKQLEIASLLYISLSTVKSHVKNIYNKLGASNKKEAVDIWNAELKNQTNFHL